VRARAAQSKTAALEESLSRLQASNPDIAQHIKSEADARERLAEVTRQLDTYVSYFGDLASAPEHAQRQAEEIHKLKLQVEQHSQVCM
jgi:E3 ubiquitin-protein ligase BRE1